MTPERTEWHLSNWARWMQAPGHSRLSVRMASLEGGYSHGLDFDDLCDDADATAAKATNAVLNDLDSLVRKAVYAAYLGERWNCGLLLSPIVEAAKAEVGTRLNRRGIL